MPRETVRLLYCVAKRDRRRIFSDRRWMKKTEKRTTHRKGIPQGAPIPPGKHLSARSRPKEKCRKRKGKSKRCFGSVRYADGEYAAEQPQGLPAVIAELTRWAAQNLEQPLKSEINVGSRLSEKRRRLKRRITKCNTGKPSAFSKVVYSLTR
jgi:hypothetical protein